MRLDNFIIPEVKKFYRLYSVWFMTALTIIPIIESQWHYFSDVIPKEYHVWAFAVFGVASVISRFISQPTIKE